MTRSLSLLALAVCLCAQAAAEEKYTIKIKPDAKGDVVMTTEKDSDVSKMSYTAMGMTRPDNKESVRSATYKEEIVEKEPEKRATKIRRTYEKAEFTENGRKITPSFIGKEVLIVRAGAKYKFTVDGKELTGDDAAMLADEFKNRTKEKESEFEDLLFPKNPVGVNETWKLDLDAVAKDLGEDAKITFDTAQSTGSGKLTKAYTKNGKQYGAFQIDFELAMTKLGAGAMTVALDKGSKAKLSLRFDGCIDGGNSNGVMEMTMEMKMSGTLTTPNGVEVKIDGNTKKTGTKTQEEAPR
jgi:hypothetical protein